MSPARTPRRTRWRPTLRLRVQVLVTLLLALLAGSGLAAVTASQHADGANRNVAQRLLPALLAVERLQKAYLDQETGVRGFALTGQQQFLAPYQAAPELIAAEYQSVRTTLDGNGDALSAVEAVQQAYSAWRTQAAEPVVSSLMDGRTGEALAIIEAGVGKRLFDALRARVDGLRSVVQELVADATARVDRARTAALWGVGWAFGLATLLAVVTMVELRRTVTRPLTGLVGRVSAVAEGDLDRPVEVDGPPEIEMMAAAVERMRRALAQYTREAVTSEQRSTKLRESERIATDLRDRVVERLFATGISLTSLASRHPDLAEPLLAAVRGLDDAIQELRGVIFDLAAGEPGRGGVRDRLVAVVTAAEPVLGMTPSLQLGGQLDGAVDDERADLVVLALRDLLSRITAAGHVAVRLTVDAGTLHLTVTHDGTPTRHAPDPAVTERTERLGGGCTTSTDEHGATVIDWTLPIGTS